MYIISSYNPICDLYLIKYSTNLFIDFSQNLLQKLTLVHDKNAPSSDIKVFAIAIASPYKGIQPIPVLLATSVLSTGFVVETIQKIFWILLQFWMFFEPSKEPMKTC